jgi:hypothetical protein
MLPAQQWANEIANKQESIFTAECFGERFPTYIQMLLPKWQSERSHLERNKD